MSGQSNEEWGLLAERDADMAQVWDGYAPLPEPGTNDALDAFVESRGFDIASLVRLGARLSEPTVIAFAYPGGGIKYRNIETGQRWSYTGSSFDELKIVKASSPSDRVALVVESETDAAKATILFPQVDVAVMPAGARYFNARMSEQLRAYQRVLVGLDNDEAGDAGSAKIVESVAHATRFAPPKGFKDWCEVDEPPSLPQEAPRAKQVGGITFTRLFDLYDAGVPEPEVLVDDALYTEGVHLVSGHPGCGKTTLVAHWAWTAMEAGRHVAWLDYESGSRQTVRRLLAMDLPSRLVDERFHYAGWPAEAEKYLGDLAAEWPGALVVIDSMSKALSGAGLDENSNTEVTRWTSDVIRGCKDNGLPIVIIDHIAKNAARSDYSRGAGAKLADVDVHWRVEKKEEFNRTTVGKIEITQKKDREGFLPFETAYRVGDGDGRLTLESIEPAADRAVTVRAKLLTFLKEHAEETFTKADAVKGAGGNADDTRKVLDELADDPSAPVVRVAGRRKNSPQYKYDASKASGPPL